MVGHAVEYGGWGGGLIIFGNSSDFRPVIALSNNIVTGNVASSGSAEFFDEGAQATVQNELIYKNRATAGGGGAILVDGCCDTRLVLNHATVADNLGNDGISNGIVVDAESTALIQNSIFWNNGPAASEFLAVNNSTLEIRYTLSDTTVSSGDGIIAGQGLLNLDPLFADPTADDYRLQTTRGRWNPATRLWVVDPVNSPALDSADPAADSSGESVPTGGRADLGAYGNRSEAFLVASRDPQGVRLRTRGANIRGYTLERSADLRTWTFLAVIDATNDYLDSSSASSPTFYRLVQ